MLEAGDTTCVCVTFVVDVLMELYEGMHAADKAVNRSQMRTLAMFIDVGISGVFFP